MGHHIKLKALHSLHKNNSPNGMNLLFGFMYSGSSSRSHVNFLDGF